MGPKTCTPLCYTPFLVLITMYYYVLSVRARNGSVLEVVGWTRTYVLLYGFAWLKPEG